MKKGFFVLAILLVLPLVSSIQIDVGNEFLKGESFLIKYSGNFVDPILEQNIHFYRDNLEIPVDYTLLKIEDDFYVYANFLNKIAGNYTIVVEGASYYVAGGQISDEDITADFEVIDELADFTVNPGVVIAEGSFDLEIQNLLDEEIQITINKEETSQESTGGFFSFFKKVEEESSDESVSIKAGEFKTITLEFTNLSNATMKKIELQSGNFTAEVYVYALVDESEEITIEKDFGFETGLVNITMSSNSNTSRIVYLQNNGDDLENVTLYLSQEISEYVNITPNFIEDFLANSTEKIILNFSTSDVTGNFAGQIKAKSSDNLTDFLDIELQIIADFVPLEEENETTTTSGTCEEKGGIICNRTSICDGQEIKADNGICCLAECVEEEKSPVGKFIGWFLLITLVGMFVWFYLKKYSKAKRRKIDFEKISQGKKGDVLPKKRKRELDFTKKRKRF